MPDRPSPDPVSEVREATLAREAPLTRAEVDPAALIEQLRTAYSLLENYGRHHEWCDERAAGLHRCKCGYWTVTVEGRPRVLTVSDRERTALAPAGPEERGEGLRERQVTMVCDTLWDNGVYMQDSVPLAREIVRRLDALAPLSLRFMPETYDARRREVADMIEEADRQNDEPAGPDALADALMEIAEGWCRVATQAPDTGAGHPFKDEWSFQRRMTKGNPVAGKPIAPDQPCFVCEVPFKAHADTGAEERLRAALDEAQATIEAMSGDAADLHDLIGEAAWMRTVLGHLLGDRGRIHDSGCGTCDAGRALLTTEHELPSSALSGVSVDEDARESFLRRRDIVAGRERDAGDSR